MREELYQGIGLIVLYPELILAVLLVLIGVTYLVRSITTARRVRKAIERRLFAIPADHHGYWAERSRRFHTQHRR